MVVCPKCASSNVKKARKDEWKALGSSYIIHPSKCTSCFYVWEPNAGFWILLPVTVLYFICLCIGLVMGYGLEVELQAIILTNNSTSFGAAYEAGRAVGQVIGFLLWGFAVYVLCVGGFQGVWKSLVRIVRKIKDVQVGKYIPNTTEPKSLLESLDSQS